MKMLINNFFKWRDLITLAKTVFLRSSLDLKTQALYALHHFHMSKASYKKFNSFRCGLIGQEFSKKGFLILGTLGNENFNISEVSQHIQLLFDSQPANKYLELPRKADPIISLFIFKVLKNFSSEIQQIFKSEFQTYWIQIYKTTPGYDEETSSFAWHQDADPRSMLKIFIYLNDVNKTNGAFRTFDREFSKKLFKKGFISNTPWHRANSQKIITPELLIFSNWIEGSAGTVAIFDNNLIHRGTFPKAGYRSVISIQVFPNKNKLDYSNVVNSLSMPIVDDFPKNPYENRYAK